MSSPRMTGSIWWGPERVFPSCFVIRVFLTKGPRQRHFAHRCLRLLDPRLRGDDKMGRWALFSFHITPPSIVIPV